MIPLWWNRFPGRLEAEERALAADGIVVRRDERAFRRGVLRLELTLPKDRWLTDELVAVYPDTFPFLRPEVSAPNIRLPRHQNPFKRNLCLLGRDTGYWIPSTTLAELLASQLPLLRRSLETDDIETVAGIEDPQGEPISAFLEYEPDSVVMIDSSWQLPVEALLRQLPAREAAYRRRHGAWFHG